MHLCSVVVSASPVTLSTLYLNSHGPSNTQIHLSMMDGGGTHTGLALGRSGIHRRPGNPHDNTPREHEAN
jgi:hypothetical protein